MRCVCVGGSGETVVRGSNLTQIKGHHYFNCRSKPLVGRGPLKRHTAFLLQAEAGRRRVAELARFGARVPSPREASSRGRPSAELSFGEVSHASPQAPGAMVEEGRPQGPLRLARLAVLRRPGAGPGHRFGHIDARFRGCTARQRWLGPGLLRESKGQKLKLHLDLRSRQGSKSPGAVTHDNDPQTTAPLGYVGLHLAALEALCRALQSPGSASNSPTSKAARGQR